MAEPREPKKMIEPNNWENFLAEFTKRNRDRRARFNLFYTTGDDFAVFPDQKLLKIPQNFARCRAFRAVAFELWFKWAVVDIRFRFACG